MQISSLGLHLASYSHGESGREEIEGRRLQVNEVNKAFLIMMLWMRRKEGVLSSEEVCSIVMTLVPSFIEIDIKGDFVNDIA